MKPKKILTQYQKDFIKDNYLSMRDKDMAEHLGLSETFLWAYRGKEHLIKNKKTMMVSMPNESEYFNVNAKTNWAI